MMNDYVAAAAGTIAHVSSLRYTDPQVRLVVGWRIPIGSGQTPEPVLLGKPVEPHELLELIEVGGKLFDPKTGVEFTAAND